MAGLLACACRRQPVHTSAQLRRAAADASCMPLTPPSSAQLYRHNPAVPDHCQQLRSGADVPHRCNHLQERRRGREWVLGRGGLQDAATGTSGCTSCPSTCCIANTAHALPPPLSFPPSPRRSICSPMPSCWGPAPCSCPASATRCVVRCAVWAATCGLKQPL